MRKVDHLRCLVISPRDVPDARDAVEAAIAHWNAHIGRGKRVVVEAVRWESHARPQVGDHPQAIINAQLVDDCDLGVAIFWTRLGSPTPAARSGSVEEIERLHRAGAEVMIYFSDEPVRPSTINDEQLAQLRAFRAEFKDRALLGTFETPEQLRSLVLGHLSGAVDALLARAAGTQAPAVAAGASTTAVPVAALAVAGPAAMPTPAGAATVLAAPRPDVRVRVHAGAARPDSALLLAPVLRIRVENHSPTDFFFSGDIELVFNNDMTAPVLRDDETGELVTAQTIRSADSFSVAVSGTSVADAIERADSALIKARVTDKIQRDFASSVDEMLRAVEDLWALMRAE